MALLAHPDEGTPEDVALEERKKQRLHDACFWPCVALFVVVALAMLAFLVKPLM